jgi:hypothetical protein
MRYFGLPIPIGGFGDPYADSATLEFVAIFGGGPRERRHHPARA